MKHILIILISIAFNSLLLAQNSTCGFNAVMNQRYEEDPNLLINRDAYEQEIQSIINSKSFFEQKTIPIVVHIIYNDSYSNISDNQVYSAMNAINEDFNGQNNEFNSVVSNFNSVKSSLDLTFVLASKDPNGNDTNGITRTQSNFTDNAGENVKSLVMWNTDMYLNIWVVDNIESGAGAYAYYPGTAPNGAEGIVTRHSQFGTLGTSSTANFASTTLTHEIGHYLNLAHTWGSTNDPELSSNCDSDDGVSDTPNTIGTLYGCSLNQSTCGSLDNVQNFMDYTDCTSMFTNGQRDRVHAALHSNQGGRINLWQYENLIATGVLNEQECTQTELVVQVSTGSWASEISWVINNIAGDAVAGGGLYEDGTTYNTSLCLAPGDYSFETFDSYGDGWNGGSYIVYACDNQAVAQDSNPSGSGEVESFTVVDCGPTLGCSDPNADNYNSEVTEDDGSCLYEGCTDYTALNYDPNSNSENGSCIYQIIPDLFNFSTTGISHTIVLTDDVLIGTIDGMLSQQDIIGVFHQNEFNETLCAGYIVWYDQTTSIAVQGDNPLTSSIDGYVEGQEFEIQVWDYSEQSMFNCSVQYNPSIANQNWYVNGGVSQIVSGQIQIPLVSQSIELPEGWSIFSSYMISESMSVNDVLSPIVSDLVVMKDYNGMAYLAEWNYNGIGDMILGQAYQIKLNTMSTLIVEGAYPEPQEQAIELQEGWNLVGYLRVNPASTEDVFSPVSTQVLLVKDYFGNAYLPEWGFNGIGNMVPGQGYQVKMNSTQYLYYNANDVPY